MIKNLPGLIEHLGVEIRKQTDVAVVGMSGGADSTLVALLCKEALGADRVYTVHMPYGRTDQEFFNARSLKTAANLGVRVISAAVTGIADAINGVVDQAVYQVGLRQADECLSTVNSGNGRSRARMTVLYGISHHLGTTLHTNVRVIGTGNLSEDFIGYDTKGGDALCDFFPIGDLFKSEVYQLLDWFRDRGDIDDDMIDRKPSAGLWEGQSDEEEIGYSYNEMEPAIRRLLDRTSKTLLEEAPESAERTFDRFVLERHLANKHKHKAPPVLPLRKFCD